MALIPSQSLNGHVKTFFQGPISHRTYVPQAASSPSMDGGQFGDLFSFIFIQVRILRQRGIVSQCRPEVFGSSTRGIKPGL